MIQAFEAHNGDFGQGHSCSMALDNPHEPTNDDLHLDLRASVILPGLINQILGHKQENTAQCVPNDACAYRDALFDDWANSFIKSNNIQNGLERDRLQSIAYDRISEEINVMSACIQKLLLSCGNTQAVKNNFSVSGEIGYPSSGSFDIPSSDAYSDSSPWESNIFSSTEFLNEPQTPATSITSSPPMHYAQPVYSPYAARVCQQQSSTYNSPQLPYNNLASKPFYSPTMSTYAASIPFFSDFLEQWLAEHKPHQSTEASVIAFIDEHRTHIDRIYESLRKTSDCALDKDKSSVRELKNFTQMEYYTAAVKTAYEIEKRMRLGPVKRNKSASVVGLNYDQRAEMVCEYLLRCKNSCLRLVKPDFITDVVDMPVKMLERFVTNTAGNAVKSNKRKLANASHLKQESKVNKVRGQRVTSGAPQPFPGRVSKPRAATKLQQSYAQDDEDCDDDLDLDYTNSVNMPHTTQMLSVDPALLHNLGTHFQPYQGY